MPRPDRAWHDFEPDDYDAPPPSQTPAGPGPALTVVLGARLVGALVLGVVAVTANRPVRPGQLVTDDQARAAAANPPRGDRWGPAPAGPNLTYTRQEFGELVLGMHPQLVIAVLGKPDEIRTDGDALRWTYRGRVRDQAGGEAVLSPVLVFRDDEVAEVTYQSDLRIGEAGGAGPFPGGP
jgi:hypothetical protein